MQLFPGVGGTACGVLAAKLPLVSAVKSGLLAPEEIRLPELCALSNLGVACSVEIGLDFK